MDFTRKNTRFLFTLECLYNTQPSNTVDLDTRWTLTYPLDLFQILQGDDPQPENQESQRVAAAAVSTFRRHDSQSAAAPPTIAIRQILCA